MDYKREYKKILDLFEENLPKQFGNGGFNTLEKSMEYSLFSGGKRIRPVIMLKIGELYGADFSRVMPYASALEMIHTYSLIHDDLPCMDNDDLRRGKPTNHKVFGYGNAVLAGDGLLNLAFETAINNITDKGTLMASKVLGRASGRCGMISGQSADLYFEKHTATNEDLQFIHENKTSAIIRSAFEMGGFLGNATPSEIADLIIFANAFGMIFQLTDDLLDKYGDEKTVGKTIGKDEKSEKSSSLQVIGEEKTRALIKSEYERAMTQLEKLSVNTDFFKELLNDTIARKM